MESVRVITWATTKVAGGYRARVYSFGYRQANETIKESVFATRAQAVGFARKWTRYLKAQQALALTA